MTVLNMNFCRRFNHAEVAVFSRWCNCMLLILLQLSSNSQSSWRSGSDLGQLYDNATPSPTGSLSGPYFVESPGKTVIGVKGKTSNLACSIKNLGNLTVSWIRHHDTHPLTTGMYRYTPDDRFSSLHKPSSENWVLELRDTKMADEGVYECQISTTPVRSLKFNLKVVDSYTTLPGSLVRHVDVGSALNITCLVVNYPLSLEYVIFYHNNKQINRNSGPYEISEIQQHQASSNYSSSLSVKSASIQESGKYHCAANPGQSEHITVHVHHGENPAGLQLNSTPNLTADSFLRLFSFGLYVITIRFRNVNVLSDK